VKPWAVFDPFSPTMTVTAELTASVADKFVLRWRKFVKAKTTTRGVKLPPFANNIVSELFDRTKCHHKSQLRQRSATPAIC